MREKESTIARVLAGLGIGAPAILIAGSLMIAVPTPARSQEAQRPTESVAEASRNFREHKARSTRQVRFFTNEDLGPQNPGAERSVASGQASSNPGAQASSTAAGECDNPEATRLREELQATSQELDRVRSEFLYGTPVISGGNLDLKSFKPGYAGLDVGALPTSDSAPPVSARVTAAQLEERISVLQKALRLACESPEAAEIDVKIFEAEQRLELLERQFALDNESHYSKPNYVEDTAGKAQLDAEQRGIEEKRSEIALLRDELAAVKSK